MGLPFAGLPWCLGAWLLGYLGAMTTLLHAMPCVCVCVRGSGCACVLWVLGQVPGFVQGGDTTAQFVSQGYWGSWYAFGQIYASS